MCREDRTHQSLASGRFVQLDCEIGPGVGGNCRHTMSLPSAPCRINSYEGRYTGLFFASSSVSTDDRSYAGEQLFLRVGETLPAGWVRPGMTIDTRTCRKGIPRVRFPTGRHQAIHTPVGRHTHCPFPSIPTPNFRKTCLTFWSE